MSQLMSLVACSLVAKSACDGTWKDTGHYNIWRVCQHVYKHCVQDGNKYSYDRCGLWQVPNINSSWHKDQTQAASSTGTWGGRTLPSCEDNKVDFALLLSSHFIERSRRVEPVVVAGGKSVVATTFKSSDPKLDVSSLRADHEEADTSLVLHCINARMETMVVSVRNTDVLLLPLAHLVLTNWDTRVCTWKLGHQKLQSIT